jgi:MerR family regulatory protein
VTHGTRAIAASGLTIGEAARRAGLTRKAVRLYEARGLLPPVERTESGYRLYSGTTSWRCASSGRPAPSAWGWRRSTRS